MHLTGKPDPVDPVARNPGRLECRTRSLAQGGPPEFGIGFDPAGTHRMEGIGCRCVPHGYTGFIDQKGFESGRTGVDAQVVPRVARVHLD